MLSCGSTFHLGMNFSSSLFCNFFPILTPAKIDVLRKEEAKARRHQNHSIVNSKVHKVRFLDGKPMVNFLVLPAARPLKPKKAQLKRSVNISPSSAAVTEPSQIKKGNNLIYCALRR